MFRNLKCKNTILCELASVALPVLLMVIAFLCGFLIPNDTYGAIALVSLLIVDLIVLIAGQNTTFKVDLILSNLRNWQKDRISFETDINGTSAIKVQEAITGRASAWGKTQQNSAALEYYKKTKTPYELIQIVHQKLVIYTMPTLTYEEYSAKLAEVKNTVYEEYEHEATTIAIIFLCDRVEQAVLSSVRADYGYSQDDNAVILPLVYDASMRQYHYNACFEYNLIIKPAKNYLLKSIKKVVFGGRLPLENNDRFDYSNEISVWADKTFGELIDHIKAERKEEKQSIKEISEQLLNGQCLFRDDELYLSHNGKVAQFLAFPDEEKPQKMLLWEPDSWEYPKQTPISKKDREILQQLARDYFETQGKTAIFDPDEM